jgi:hypothetical protein
MKKIIILITFLFINLNSLFSLGPVKFGFFAGLSTPNDKLANVYNRETISFTQEVDDKDKDVLGNFVSNGIDNGYHFGANVKFEFPGRFSIITSFSYHSFPENLIDIQDDETKSVSFKLLNEQALIPVTVGGTFDLFKLGSFAMYLRGDIQYNYFVNNARIELADENGNPTGDIRNLQLNYSNYARLGAGFGSGFDISLGLTTLNLDVRYNFTNLALTEADEELKSFVSFGLGIYF